MVLYVYSDAAASTAVAGAVEYSYRCSAVYQVPDTEFCASNECSCSSVATSAEVAALHDRPTSVLPPSKWFQHPAVA